MKSGAFTTQEKRAIAGLSAVLGARMLGFSLVLPVFAAYALQMPHATKLLAGLAFGAYGLAQALLQIPLGRLSDRLGRRTVVCGGLAVFIAGCAVAALATDIYVLSLGFFLQGCGAVASALFAWVTDVTAPERRNFSMAILGMSIGASIVLGLSAAEPLAALIGTQRIFVLCGVLSTFALLVVLFMAEPDARSVDKPSGLVWARELLVLNGLGFLMNATMRAVFFAVPLALHQQFAVPAERMWTIYVPLGLAGGIAMLASSRRSDRGQGRSMIIAAMTLTAVAYVFLGQVASYASTVLGYLAYFAGFSMLEALLPAAVSKLAAADSRGHTMGMYNTSQYLGTFAGGALAGGLPTGALYGLLLVATVLGMAAASTLRRIDDPVLEAEPART